MKKYQKKITLSLITLSILATTASAWFIDCNDDNDDTVDTLTDGICYHVIPDGTACDDGDSGTVLDIYTDEICKGTPYTIVNPVITSNTYTSKTLSADNYYAIARGDRLVIKADLKGWNKYNNAFITYRTGADTYNYGTYLNTYEICNDSGIEVNDYTDNSQNLDELVVNEKFSGYIVPVKDNADNTEVLYFCVSSKNPETGVVDINCKTLIENATINSLDGENSGTDSRCDYYNSY